MFREQAFSEGLFLENSLHKVATVKFTWKPGTYIYRNYSSGQIKSGIKEMVILWLFWVASTDNMQKCGFKTIVLVALRLDF